MSAAHLHTSIAPCRGHHTSRYEGESDLVPHLPFGSIWRHAGTMRTTAQCVDGQKKRQAGSMPMVFSAADVPSAVQANATTGTLPHATLGQVRYSRRLHAAFYARRAQVIVKSGSPGSTGGGCTPQQPPHSQQVSRAVEQQQLSDLSSLVHAHSIETYARNLYSCLKHSDRKALPPPHSSML